MCAANVSTTMSNWSSTAGSNQPDSTDLASTLREDLQAIQAAVATVFPGMAGQAWREQEKASNYPLAVTDNMSLINVTGAATISGTAAALGNGFMCLIFNSHTAAVTIPGSYSLQPLAKCILHTDGTSFFVCPFATEGWQLISSSAASTSSSITLTGGSVSAYKAHMVSLTNIVLSADASISIRVGSSSIDTGNNYVWNGISSDGTTVTTATSGATSAIQLTGTIEQASNVVNIDIILRTSSAVNRQYFSAKIGYINSSAAFIQNWVEGYYNGGFDRIQVYPSTGNFTSGLVSLYGQR